MSGWQLFRLQVEVRWSRLNLIQHHNRAGCVTGHVTDSAPMEPPAKPTMFVPTHDNQISVLLNGHARNFFGRVSRAYNGVGGNARVKLAQSEFLQSLRVFMLQPVFLCHKVE